MWKVTIECKPSTKKAWGVNNDSVYFDSKELALDYANGNLSYDWLDNSVKLDPQENVLNIEPVGMWKVRYVTSNLSERTACFNEEQTARSFFNGNAETDWFGSLVQLKADDKAMLVVHAEEDIID